MTPAIVDSYFDTLCFEKLLEDCVSLTQRRLRYFRFGAWTMPGVNDRGFPNHAPSPDRNHSSHKPKAHEVATADGGVSQFHAQTNTAEAEQDHVAR